MCLNKPDWYRNHTWHFFLCQLPQRIRGNKLSDQRSEKIKGMSDKTMTHRNCCQVESFGEEPHPTFLLSVVGVEIFMWQRGFPLTAWCWVATFKLMLDVSCYTCSNLLFVAVFGPPAASAGHMCRHHGFWLQRSPPPNATVTHSPLFQHFLQSDLAAQWCATISCP